ncbi:MAG: hypothetical protein ABI806_26805 [Candidatus Solibacter sp.]
MIDSVVLSHFGLKLPPAYSIEGQGRIAGIYRGLAAHHAELAASPLGSMIRELFDQKYSKTNLTPLKKVDLVLCR